MRIRVVLIVLFAIGCLAALFLLGLSLIPHGETAIDNAKLTRQRDVFMNKNDPGIVAVVGVNDDPHEQAAKKDAFGNHEISPRIVGGSDVPRGEYPFFVRVDHNWYPTCGGSLVAPDVILTAGHCQKKKEGDRLSVIVNGFHDSPSLSDGQYPRLVVETVVHPNYNPTAWAYFDDVMLMKLDEPVTDIAYVEINRDTSQPAVSEQVTVMGLGRLSEYGGYPAVLQVVNLEIASHEECFSSYDGVGMGPIVQETMVCAGSITNIPQDSCQGDSGGPVINANGVQVGVISFGLGCAREGYPSVNARTAVPGQDWIHEALCNLTSSSSLDEWCGKPLPSTGTTPEPSMSPSGEPSSRPSLKPSEKPSESPTTTKPVPPPTEATDRISAFSQTDQPPIFINAGSTRNYTDPEGNKWLADTGYYNTGSRSTTSNTITNTNRQTIYQSERFKPMTYSIDLLPGSYDVYLHMAEIYRGAFRPGARLFNVYMEEQLVAERFDIFVAAGNEGNRAVVLPTYNVVVDDGTLTIKFERVKQVPKLSGIEVRPAGSRANAPTTTTTTRPNDPVTTTASVSAGSVAMQQPIRINAGSYQNYTDPQGNVWMGDAGLFGVGAKQITTNQAISNTDKPNLFQSERYRGKMTFSIEVLDGVYEIRLYFAEVYQGASSPGKRVFDVFIEGVLVADNFDIYVAAGNESNKAFILNTTDIAVTGGTLTIEFVRVKQKAKVSTFYGVVM